MLARYFIERPIAAWVISIVIVLLGVVSYLALPIAQYPDITPPTVQVTASYPGANAIVVADSVAAPIEQQVNGVERMLYMSSQCTNDGAYTLTITFELGADLNMAQVLVQNRVALAMPQLPQEVQVQGVSTKKKSPSILLVVNLVSTGGSQSEENVDIKLSNYATVNIKDKLLSISGVGDIQYLGQRDFSMRVWLDPDKLAARGLSAKQVVDAVKNQNIQVAAGNVGQQPAPKGQQFQFTMSTLGRLSTEADFGNIIVKAAFGDSEQGTTSTSQIVRLRDVAEVKLGAQQYDQIATLDGRPTVGLAIFQLPGSNALDVAKKIKKTMAELKKDFPQGIDYEIVYDTTPFIEQSIEEVIHTLLEAVFLVAVVVLFFLQDWKAMILPMIDVPVSLVGTFAVMAVMGFTLNNLTLFGLVLAIGIVVDDAIVVLENIERLIGTGLDAKTATIKAMDEVTGPIIGITLVLVSVFLPAAFIPGITGQFFRQFALTIASAMVISAINAMTLTPARAVAIFKTEGGHGGSHEHTREALPWWIFGVIGGYLTYKFGYKLVAHALGVPVTEEEMVVSTVPASYKYAAMLGAILPGLLVGGVLGWLIIKPLNRTLSVFFKAFNRAFDRFTDGYSSIVTRFVRFAAIVLLAYGGMLFATYWTMAHAPTGFIPMQDQGYLLINVQLPDAASVQRTNEVMEKLNRIVLGDDTGKYYGTAPKNGKKYPGIPGVAHAQSIAGQSFLLSANGSNLGSMFVILQPFKDRESHEKYDEVIAAKVRELAASEIDDAIVTAFRAPPIQGLGNAGGFKFQVQQRGFVDYPELQQTVDEMCRIGNQNPKLVGLFSTYRAETPQLFVDIDRVKCESLGVKVQDVFSTLQAYMGGQFVNLFNKEGRTWQVIVMADQKYRSEPRYVRQLQVANIKGEMVPIGTVASIRDSAGPIMVTRYNLYNSAAVSGNTAPGVSSGDAIATIDKLGRDLGVTFEWTEITFLQILAGSATYIFMLGTLLVYMVLAFKYESWHLPLSVILVVPMCLLSSVIGMLIAALPVDIFVQIGFLVLVGLAAKNAILIVEFAEQLRMEGKTPADAIVMSCKLRFRPIVMTSFAFILGVVPLMLGTGAGAEMRRSLGTAVFAGMCGVTAFGVFLTPVFYYSIQKFGAKTPPPPLHPVAETAIVAATPH